MNNIRECPICKSKYHRLLLDHKAETFDQYSCFRHIRVASCEQCGFIFNDTSYTQDELNKFYNNETPYLSQTGTGSGGNTDLDMRMYDIYTAIIEPYIHRKSRICDVGCAKGGYLNFLKTKGYEHVFGVEPSLDLIKKAKLSGLTVQQGSAENIPLPFDREKYDCLIFNNVFEHLLDFSKVLPSVVKCLSSGGYVFIDVPDADYYHKYEFYPYYSLVNPREHINHFSEYHLSLLMNNFGFKNIFTAHNTVRYTQSCFAPALMMLFEYTPPPPPPIGEYITTSNKMLKKLNIFIDDYVENQKPLHIWGIGAEFFVLASFTRLLDCNIISLIDKNKEKQSLTYNNMKILSPEILQKIKDTDTILLCSVFNNDAMRQYLQDSKVHCSNVVQMSDILNDGMKSV